MNESIFQERRRFLRVKSHLTEEEGKMNHSSYDFLYFSIGEAQKIYFCYSSDRKQIQKMIS